MLINKKHLSWGIRTGIAAALFIGLFFAINWSAPSQSTGGSRSGLFFGIMAAIAMGLAGFLAVKKSFPLLKIGNSQTWMRIHIWIGLLSVPLALCHTGLEMGGWFETILMWFFYVVILSGIYGLALQQVLPRILKVRVEHESFPQQIEHLCRMFTAEGDCLVAEQSGPLGLDPAPLQDAPRRFATIAGKLKTAKESDFEKYIQSVYPASAVKTEDSAPDQESKPSKADMLKALRTPANQSNEGQGNADGKSAKQPKPKPSLADLRKPAATPTGNPPSPQESQASTATLTVPVDQSEAEDKPKGLSTKDKLAALRAMKSGAAQAAAAEKPAEGSPGGADGEPAPSQALSTKDKLAALKAMNPTPAKDSQIERPEENADGDSAPQKALSTKDKLAAIRAKKSAPAKSHSAGAAVPAKPKSPIGTKVPRGREAKEPEPFQPAPGSQGLKKFYLAEVRPFLIGSRSEASKLKLENSSRSERIFSQQKTDSPEPILEVLNRLEEMCEERRHLIVQQRIQFWLHNWLWVHWPLSMFLFVLLFIHIITALWVVPWWGL